MSEQAYRDALKRGQKTVHAQMSHGVYPYLPALEDMLGKSVSSRGTDIGTFYIPTEWIVGTYTRGRADAFACDFMPLLPEQSEFAYKWKQLYRSHLEEGIRDPVKVVSYLNRYYVVEGNKRVSILKFLDAPEIAAHIIRVMPELEEEGEMRRQLELIAFQRDSGIYYIEFSKTGSAQTFSLLAGKEPKERWDEEERRAMHGAYDWFCKAYEALGGKRLGITVGDAMLVFLRVYGYEMLRSASLQELKNALRSIWEELCLLEEEEPVEVLLNPTEEQKPGLLERVFGSVPRGKLKVAFIYDRNPETSGWTLGHELGRRYVSRILENSVETSVYPDAVRNGEEETLTRAIEDGNSVLFTTSALLMPASLKLAAAHPELMIWNCSLKQSHRLVRTYYARMYEAKFIIGAIAGALAGTEQIGYIADFPLFGQVAGVNAFALGAEMVNPSVQVRLEWSGTAHVQEARKKLRDEGISLISAQDMAKLTDWHGASFGLARFEAQDSVNLAMPVWDWGVFYETLLRRILSGQERAEYEKSHKALNYYYGMSAGVVSLQLSDALPEAVKRLSRILEKSVREGICDPFRGKVTAQDGSIIADAHSSPELSEIIEMNTLVSNVIGEIPPPEAFGEGARAVLETAGGSGL